MDTSIFLRSASVVTNQSMASTFSTPSQEVKDAIRLCYQYTWTGSTPVGSVQVQCSADNINWSSDPEATAVALSGNTGCASIKVSNCSYPYSRLTYTATSGTGTFSSITLAAKSL